LNPTRAEIIEKYLGSSGVRTAILKKDSEKQGLPDKVNNVPLSNVQHMLSISEQPKLIKTARHIVHNKQVVYQ
jgi:hypothetical protein